MDCSIVDLVSRPQFDPNQSLEVEELDEEVMEEEVEVRCDEVIDSDGLISGQHLTLTVALSKGCTDGVFRRQFYF